ncbi:hypothetical protein L2E82_31533 [Cichorium intybus]|uniref:Uncharacterized protein n=1 Tax=Cichorium intybus TaxID=13427 RepID=A0ACB9BE73_CICIN|nr:hypothetical protein L2E82_31533 [Cichorium intybus]
MVAGVTVDNSSHIGSTVAVKIDEDRCCGGAMVAQLETSDRTDEEARGRLQLFQGRSERFRDGSSRWLKAAPICPPFPLIQPTPPFSDNNRQINHTIYNKNISQTWTLTHPFLPSLLRGNEII